MREALVKAKVCTSLSFDQFMQQKSAVPAIFAFMEKTGLLGQFHAVDPDAMGLEPASALDLAPDPEQDQPEQQEWQV